MAGRAHRPLPAVPTDDLDYEDPGFEEGEFSDREENGNVGQMPDSGSSDEDDYLEPEPTPEVKPVLPPRQPSWGRLPPPPPTHANDPPACPPRGKPQPLPRQLPPQLPPQRRRSDPPPTEEYKVPQLAPQETYEDMNECVSRPGLPTPIPQQDEYLEPGKGEWSGPTEDYIEIPGGVDANHNRSAPPLPSDDLYQDIPESMQEIMATSALTKEILEKQLKPSTRELPETPTQGKAIKGFQMVTDINTIKIKGIKEGLRKTAKSAFPERAPNCETSGVDPCEKNFKAKREMFGQIGQKVVANPPHQPQTFIRTKPSPRGSTVSNSSNRSDSGIDLRDSGQDFAIEPLASRQQRKELTPSLHMSPLEEQPMLPPAEQWKQPTSPMSAQRRLPTSPLAEHWRQPTSPLADQRMQPTSPLAEQWRQPADTMPAKRPLPSRPLPNVPHSKNLSSYPWYFGNLDRTEANSRVKALRQDGAYLVRDSTRDPSSPYTLSILFGSKVWCLHIRNRRDGMFAIGSEKRDEECFASVPELIEHHMQFSIILAGRDGGETRLIKHPRK